MGILDGILKTVVKTAKIANDISKYVDSPDSFSLQKCPQCSTTMKYSYEDEEFMCPVCGSTYDQNDFDLEDDDDSMPAGCASCGGPWPDCMSSCKMYDDAD